MSPALRATRSLMGRFALVGMLLFVAASAASWFCSRRPFRDPPKPSSRTGFSPLRASYAAIGQRLKSPVWPFGPGDVELVWQIATEDGAVYRSDLLFFEDIVLPAPDDLSVSFIQRDVQTPIGSFRTVMRRLIENVPSAPDRRARVSKTVTYWAAITTDRQQAIMEEHAAPFERAALFGFSVWPCCCSSSSSFLASSSTCRFAACATRPPASRPAPRTGSRVISQARSRLSTSQRHAGAKRALVERTRRYIGKIGRSPSIPPHCPERPRPAGRTRHGETSPRRHGGPSRPLHDTGGRRRTARRSPLSASACCSRTSATAWR
ncbi:MAG: hypothetical protein R3C97_17440 [Geminicoccaceae bacterium]